MGWKTDYRNYYKGKDQQIDFKRDVEKRSKLSNIFGTGGKYVGKFLDTLTGGVPVFSTLLQYAGQEFGGAASGVSRDDIKGNRDTDWYLGTRKETINSMDDANLSAVGDTFTKDVLMPIARATDIVIPGAGEIGASDSWVGETVDSGGLLNSLFNFGGDSPGSADAPLVPNSPLLPDSMLEAPSPLMPDAGGLLNLAGAPQVGGEAFDVLGFQRMYNESLPPGAAPLEEDGKWGPLTAKAWSLFNEK